MMKELFLLLTMYKVVCCHTGHRHKHTPQWLFLTQNKSKAFLRHVRSAPNECFANEPWCEQPANKLICYSESASESYCSETPTPCSAGQECYLEEACPAHYRTGCRDYDECESNPCQNGGMCNNGNNEYTCTCASGFTGTNCEVDIDECHSNPCKHQATCTDEINGYTCTCAPGYTGTNCQTDIDECQSNPCGNGATCTDGVNGYTCTCAPGYTEANCQTDIDECQSGPCNNGAACTDAVNGYTCICSPGFVGTHCQTNVDDCESNPCKNGAACVDGINNYSCNCVPGYVGTDCQTDYDECGSDPCQNGAACDDGVNSYTCVCEPGYIGSDCEIDNDECISDPCQNGAACTDKVNGYTCTCAPGYVGTNCQTDYDECGSDPCKNGAACDDSVNSYTCICEPGYIGSDCETDYDECISDPCQNGATCTDNVNGYTCNCAPGYVGTTCQIDYDECGSNPCENGATCLDYVNSYSCKCEPGYVGTNCQTDYDECGSDPCQNGAACIDEINSYMCICVPGYVGTNCDIDYDECTSNPCQNGAACTDKINSYTCTCVPGYTGTDCETDVDECSSNPCLNGATCNNEINRYTCTCLRNFIGTNCETDSCHAVPADIVFLMDSSQSQGSQNFDKQRDFITSFIKYFEIGPAEMQVSIITFSFDAKIAFYLNTHSNNNSLQTAIQSIEYDAGATYTGSGLRAALEDIYLNSSSGARWSSRKYVIVMTDGMASDRSDALLYSAALQQFGVNVITIGIGSMVSHSELLGISGESSNVFTVENTDALNTVIYDLAGTVQSCENCYRNVSDVVFLVDTSTSVTEEEFNGNIDSVMYLVSIFNIGSNDVRVGIVTYAEDVDIILNFQTTFNKDDIYKKVQSIFRSHTVVANTSKALKYTHQKMFTTSNGHRESSRKIVVLFTSGRFGNDGDDDTELQHIISDGISLVAVGYGTKINRTSLLNLVSDAHMFFNPGDIYGTHQSQSLPPIKNYVEFSNCGA